MKTFNVNCTSLVQVDPNHIKINDSDLATQAQTAAPPSPITVDTTKQKNKLHPKQKTLIRQIEKSAGARSQTTPPEGKSQTASSTFDKQKIVTNGLLSGLSIGPTFGTATALNNYLRLNKNVSPSIKVAVGFGPMIAGVASSIVAEGIRNFFDIQGTSLEKESLMRDAATPTSFITISSIYGYLLLAKIIVPRNPSLMTIAVATLGSSIGGALSEMVGQKIPEATSDISSSSNQSPNALQVGIGRSITQIPTVMFNHLNVAHIVGTGSMPALLLKPSIVAATAYPLVVGIPFIGRKYVTPNTPKVEEQTGIDQ